MEHFFGMHVLDYFQHTSCDIWWGFLGEKSLVWNFVIELAIATEFHEKIEVLLIVKKSVQFDNPWMVQVKLNFKLPNELFKKFWLN